MSPFKRLFAAMTLGMTIASPALSEGDPKPGLLDLITTDSIANSLASTAISALRTQMEIEYEHLATDILRGTITFSGVTLRPQLPYDRARQCEITVQRASLDLGNSRPALAAANGAVTLVGLDANIACVPRELGLGLRAAGYAQIAVDRLGLEVAYVHGTGEIRVNGTAAVNDLATLDYAAAGALLPRLNEFGRQGDPAIRVRRAVLGLRDNGGWSRISSQIPENLRDAEIIRGLGTEELTDMLSENGTRALTATERLFIEDLMEHVALFVRDPGEITIEAQVPAAGIVLEPEIYEKPAELLQALAPDARIAPIARSQLVDTALLARMEDELAPRERLDLARALLEGRGVPRADALIPGLLAPLRNGDSDDAAQAALLTARAQMPTDPVAAYVNALAASSARLRGTIPLLDALETRLTTGEVIAAQDAHLATAGAQDSSDALPGGGDIRAVRTLALAHFTGLGQPRNYARAYYYALIAEAAGDIGARPLREDIEARFANRGADVADLWTGLRAEIQNRALGDWIALDLSARFGRDG